MSAAVRYEETQGFSALLQKMQSRNVEIESVIADALSGKFSDREILSMTNKINKESENLSKTMLYIEQAHFIPKQDGRTLEDAVKELKQIKNTKKAEIQL